MGAHEWFAATGDDSPPIWTRVRALLSLRLTIAVVLIVGVAVAGGCGGCSYVTDRLLAVQVGPEHPSEVEVEAEWPAEAKEIKVVLYPDGTMECWPHPPH